MLPLSQNRITAITALVGCLLLVFGAFLPLAGAPLVGSVNSVGHTTGWILMACGLWSAALIFMRNLLAASIMGGGALALLIGQFVTFGRDMSGLQGNPFAVAVQIQSGWAVMAVGALLLLLAPCAERLLRVLSD